MDRKTKNKKNKKHFLITGKKKNVFFKIWHELQRKTQDMFYEWGIPVIAFIKVKYESFSR